jgi:hypothetical protein
MREPLDAVSAADAASFRGLGPPSSSSRTLGVSRTHTDSCSMVGWLHNGITGASAVLVPPRAKSQAESLLGLAPGCSAASEVDHLLEALQNAVHVLYSPRNMKLLRLFY